MSKPQPEALPFTPRGLSRTQAAAYVGLGVTKFAELVEDGRMPQPIRIDGRVIWDRWKLDAAFDALTDQSDNRWREPVA